MNRTRAYRLFIPFIFILSFCLASCSKKSPLQMEAEDQAQKWFEKVVIKCGDDYFARYTSGYSGGHAFFELKNPSYKVQEFKKMYTEADRLNDEVYDWEGSASVQSTQYREVRYGGESMRWEEGTPRRRNLAPELTPEGPPLISQTLRKKDGQWIVDTGDDTKFDCDNLPR